MNMNNIISESFKKPCWLHPFRRIRYNRLVRDLKCAAMAMAEHEDKIAPLFIANPRDLTVEMTYCYNGTGDMAQHRATYIFNGYNRLHEPAAQKRFYDTVVHPKVQ